MVRRHPALSGAGAVLGLLLAGCAHDPAGLPTTVDLERAERVWSDPWVAPDDASVPGVSWGAPDGFVSRSAGRRSTEYRGGTPTDALVREVTAATTAGWSLAGATCGAKPSASLTRGDGLEDGAVAVVTAEELRPVIAVEVTAAVPHHLDGDWPVTATGLDLADTCLGGGAETGRSLGELSDGEPVDPPEDPEQPDSDEWQRDSPTDDEQALYDAVNADPWVQGLGLRIDPTLRADDARRHAPGGELSLRGQTVADVLADMEGWELTWMSCGRGRATEATARLTTDAGVAVTRLTELRGATDVGIRLPIPETPDPEWVAEVPVLEEPTCLSSPPTDDSVVLEGVPVALLGQSQPFAG